MTREEQINQAAWKYDRENLSPGSEDYKVEGFIAGVKWAESHPNWHKFPDEKPQLKQRILICTTKGRIVETVWLQPMLISGESHGEPTFDDNRYTASNVIAWMEKPQTPKFD